MAEAIAFQREVGRATDRRGGRTSTNMPLPGRGSGGMSSPMSGAYGSGDRTAAATPRGLSRQPVPQKLATPEQLFGLPNRPPTSVPSNAPAPVTQQPAPQPVASFEPVQVDVHKVAAQAPGPGLVGSRWATSGTPNTVSDNKPAGGFDAMDVDPESFPADFAKDAGNAGVTMNQGKSFHSSFSNAALDTPEVPKPSKGLMSSKWASFASPSSPSPSTHKFPDPATLEPVYVSKDWLSDLSAEYEALAVKNKHAGETQPSRISPAIQPTGTQTAAHTAKPPASGATQHSGQTTINLSAASQADTAVQSAARPVAPDASTQGQTFDRRSGPSPTRPAEGSSGFREQPVQQNNTNANPSAEPSHTPASAHAANDQSPAPTTNTAPGGIFNDSAFKDWYNSQFMRRKA
ncbi:hypothetical protein INS49_006648 [Diaporthe citri]|uniref:uncharacterized protein n=1 Tax=Diaporthe citri TaxID=83186 RepID=UPI001C824525|nr:uncharacterized protein INS49_006648 [Diaporthe citri]KAG6365042.1 hypothetical protein INS49_006648 [Diaporthe citri]